MFVYVHAVRLYTLKCWRRLYTVCVCVYSLCITLCVWVCVQFVYCVCVVCIVCVCVCSLCVCVVLISVRGALFPTREYAHFSGSVMCVSVNGVCSVLDCYSVLCGGLCAEILPLPQLCLFPHKLSVWPLCGNAFNGGRHSQLSLVPAFSRIWFASFDCSSCCQ